MDRVQTAWLAGLLEGEGSFCHGPPSAPNLPQLSIQMTDLDVVQRAAKIMGAVTVWSCPPGKPHHKKSFKVTVRGRRAVEIMRLIRPHLGKRRGARVDEILDRYRPDPRHRNNRTFPPDEMILKTRGLSLRKAAAILGVSPQYVLNRRNNLGM